MRNKKGIWISSIFLVLLVIGGMYAVEKWNTPDTPAFNDKFTKEFLLKDAKTPEGFHMLESGTKKYTVLMPDNYVIAKGSYYRKKGIGSESPDIENLYISQQGISAKKDNLIKGVNFILTPDGNNLVDTSVDTMLEKMGAREKVAEKYQDENKTVFYANDIKELKTEYGQSTILNLFAFITDNHSKQAIYFEMKHTCLDSDIHICSIDFEKEKNMGIKMLKSIKFNEK